MSCCQAQATTIVQADNFVNLVYTDLLSRPADSSAYATYGLPLAGGSITTTQIAQAMLGSMEYRTDLVDSYYASYLNRIPAPLEAGLWVNQIAAGATDQGVQRDILGSTEFFGDQGSTNSGFITALYAGLLHRSPAPNEEATFVDALNAMTLTRTGAAGTMLGSIEYDDKLVASYFAQFLARPPDSFEINAFQTEMQGGATNEQVIAQIIGSTEFFDLAQTSVAASSAPEPASWALVGIALCLVAANYARSFRKSKRSFHVAI